VAQRLNTSVLLLFVGLGACPQLVVAGQREPRFKPLPAPLLPAEEVWQVELTSPPSADGALDHAHAYFPLRSGSLIALNRETGATVWTIDLEEPGPLALEDGVVFVVSGGRVHAIQGGSGGRVWDAPLGGGLITPLAVLRGTLVALVEPGHVKAFRTSDGQQLWERALTSATSTAAIALDLAGVYVSFGSRLVRLDRVDGTVRWETELPGTLGAPTLGTDRVFVGSSDKAFYALHPEEGRLEWWRKLGGDAVGAASQDGVVYVAALDNLLRALRSGGGNQIWTHKLTTRPIAPPSAFGGIVMVSGRNPGLSTLNALTGEAIATLTTPPDLAGVPLVDPMLRPFRVAMVAVTRSNRAIGLRPTGMMFRERPLAPLQALPGRALSREPFPKPDSKTGSGPAPTKP
jgi:outer membrane protein assembly factor BamB